MIKRILKNKSLINRRIAPYEATGFRSGFVILFAITLTGILLAITLGAANIALKELNFSTSAKDTNEAFFAADTGIECALLNDQPSKNSFKSGGSGKVQCLGISGGIDLDVSHASDSPPYWTFVIPSLGSATPPQACAMVKVTKDNVNYAPLTQTIIDSKGYNIGNVNCNSSNAGRVERALKLTYGASAIAFISSTENATSSPALGINKPAGVVQNNILIASISLPSATTLTPPSGWTSLSTDSNNGHKLATYYKIAGGSEPSNYSWDLGPSSTAAGVMMAFSGVNTTTPINVQSGQAVSNSSYNSATPSVSATVLHTMVITVHGALNATSWTPPSGMIEAIETSYPVPFADNGFSIEINYVSQPLAGSTGVKTAVQNTSAGIPAPDFGNAQIIVLQP